MKNPFKKDPVPQSCDAARSTKKGFFLENRWIAWSLVACAIVLIGWSTQVHHRIYYEAAKTSGIDLFEEVSELQLTDDSTFSGVESYEKKLYTTYDRTKPKTKQACPT